jgi:hypothetical protein
MPIVNELSSDRPLIRALMRTEVPGDEIALYYAPHLWAREMPRHLFAVRYMDADGLEPKFGPLPEIIATQSRHADDLGPRLASNYVKIDEVRMIGKAFDVYRRR